MSEALQILTLRFGKGHEGEWSIQSMKGIDLKPRTNDNQSFFPLKDDLIMEQPSFIGTTRFLLGQSIVPVVAHVPGESVLRCLGTGFFISCSGLLITATHVVTDPIERKYGGITELDEVNWDLGDLKLGVMIPLNPVSQGDGFIYRDITWATFLAKRSESPLPIAGSNLKLTTDTAICQVDPIADGIPHQPLSIVQSSIVGHGMSVGKTATVVGYGDMQDVELRSETDKVMSGDFQFNLHVSTGKIIERFPDNLIERQVPTPGACFSASLQLPPGMSGSPIFDAEGIYVHGVVSRGWTDESGLAQFGYGSMLAHSLKIPIKHLNDKTLYDLHKMPEHGFPKLGAPDL